MPTHALVRDVPASFAQALSAMPPDPPIDVARARAQHAAYVAALRAAGLEVVVVPTDERYPDACFVEDTAVVAAGLAVVTRPGAPSRQGEVDAVAAALATQPGLEVARLSAPATLDGGDCMRVARTIYVGRSARTNAAGVAQLAELMAPRGVAVVPVELPASVLHLKCVVSPLSDTRILLAEGSLPAASFPGVEIVWVPAGEAYAANAVAVGGRALVAEGFPRARAAIERAGFEVTAIANGEFRKADGSLTCLSILV
jgi:dimethylargininase